MKNILKYILIFTYITLFVYVTLVQFTNNAIFIYAIGAIIGIAFILVAQKHLNKQPFNRILLVGTFFLLISIPLAGEKETESFEKRELAEFPNFRWSNVWKFFFGYQTYFNDRFAFRNDAVQAISKFRFKLFNISPMPKIVRVGEDDWLFTSRDEYIFDTSTPFSDALLDTVILNLQITTKYFDLRNIHYYFCMVPVKERIYPEYMPADLLHKMKYSKADQLYERLKQHPEIRSINCKDVLIEGKKIRPTFYTADTHWNQFGAFLAYQKIMERIKMDFPIVDPLTNGDITLDSVITDAGDLQILMGFRDVLTFTRYEINFKNNIQPTIIDSSGYAPGSTRYSIREMPSSKSGLKLFLVRDSFSEYLKFFITRNFDRTVMAWVPVIPVAKVVEENPDIVVHEILEHFVRFTYDLPPEIKSDTLFLTEHFPEYLKNSGR